MDAFRQFGHPENWRAQPKSGRGAAAKGAAGSPRSVQAAFQAGVLLGGGSAFLHCIPLVESLECADEDEQMGCRAVARALWRPFE
ncbi:MAG: hypothetical protein MUO77_19790 [Anaerolineales bacterium]|nr:hypothetical protein [Anaerolineales bacterium]